MTYAIAEGRFRTATTDAEGNVRRTFRDVRELIRRVAEEEGVVTTYAYDALRQITRVTDTAGNTTRIAYDLLGRRTVIDNPDAGRTETVYDPAGNAVERITAELAEAGEAIRYEYEFNRLAAIRYPTIPRTTWPTATAPPGTRRPRRGTSSGASRG